MGARRSSLSCLFGTPLFFLVLLVRASSFSWPQSTHSPKTRRSRRLEHGNGTDLLDLPQSCDPRYSNLYEWDSDTTLLEQADTTLLEQELISGYIEQQSILNAPNIQLKLEQPGPIAMPPEPESALKERPTASITLPIKQPSETPILNDVWKARLLLLLSAVS